MNTPLRVLIVEDTPDDAELTLRELRRGGYEPIFERVETAEQMQAALEKQDWEIVLCDYNLPAFGAREALELLTGVDLDIPFIVVSGKIGEQTAVEMMRSGAHDYVMKDNLTRLGAAVKRELAEAHIRREHRQAEQEIQNLAKFPAESPDPMLRIARHGIIIFANRAAHPLLHAWSSQDQQGAVLPAEWSKLAGDVLISGQREDIENEYNGRTFLLTFAPVVEAAYVNLYARDITRRKQAEEQLRTTLEETVNALASVLEQRDPYTSGHQRRVAQLACAIAEEMGLSGERVDGLRLAGVIHDVGKISVPAEILSKPSRLNEMEFNIIKTHPQAGHDVLKKIEFPWPIAQMVFQHHERMDGSGYPQGLSGEDILLEARILGVADVVEAMSSHRPYRPALGKDKALAEVLEAKGTLYDPDVVDACLKLFAERDFKFE